MSIILASAAAVAIEVAIVIVAAIIIKVGSWICNQLDLGIELSFAG